MIIRKWFLLFLLLFNYPVYANFGVGYFVGESSCEDEFKSCKHLDKWDEDCLNKLIK